MRKNRTISYGAIHAINSTSPLYLQPFGVVQLTVSAAGADTDIRLDAVPGTLQLEQCRETSRETLRGTSRETINLQCPDASTQQESALEQPTSQSRRRPPIQQLLWRHKTAPKRTHLRRTQPLTFISRRFPHRITVTGANGLAQFVLITRRTRVQSVTRSTTLWREPHGIERITMPLFVTNGLDTLRFLFLHRADADILSRWADGPTEV
ncbi:hypothetical protein ACJ8KP_03315 [Bifidobacterium breve]|uniref:hypothetical protein n=2 Tax=Bifidobacterium breve TaxID=1685 RepID=UPI001E3D2584|nr:hypothetical protein [Bifidobacterium breve]